MNPIDEKILKLSNEVDISDLTLREIGSRIGGAHPQTVKNSLIKLKGIGLISKSRKKDFIKEINDFKGKGSLLYKIPILGSANCGEATLLAEENLQGFLTISTTILRKRDKMFALQASGDSMNKADVEGDSIEDGDFVIIDGNQQNPTNNDYVLSVIDGSANIKKFIKDEKRQIIILISESTSNHPPIYIHMEDFPNYFINGKVLKVIKKPSIK